MLTKRIIPCLDVDKGSVVKGVNFVRLQKVGDPVELASEYYKAGADELAFLDITATPERRKTLIEVVMVVAREIFIPFSVGGGIRTKEDARKILLAGADKVTINSAAVQAPELIENTAAIFGSQSVVLAVDAKRADDRWEVYINGGRKPTGKDAIEWVKEAVNRGAGEVLLTSIDKDGTQSGFDIKLTAAVCEAIDVPVIASGGAGKIDHFIELFQKTDADAALAASIFHYGQMSISSLKQKLRNRDIAIR